ncbi:MAG: hypothetical protein FJ098_04940 [Deltaproteobacteria bacterium]|nr:hypothetical protein [Deltaproteobacteria bacterium]
MAGTATLPAAQQGWEADIGARVRAEEYRIDADGSPLRFHNRGQNFRGTFDVAGWHLQPSLNPETIVALAAAQGNDPDADRRRGEIRAAQGAPAWRFSLSFAGVGRALLPDGTDAASGGIDPVEPAAGRCDGSDRAGVTEGCFRQVEWSREGI